MKSVLASLTTLVLFCSIATASELKPVAIELDGYPTSVYVEEYNVGIDPVNTFAHVGDRIRVCPGKAPRRSDLNWRMEYRQKSHMVDQEEDSFPLIYRYNGESNLKFEQVVEKGKKRKWYRIDGETKTLVAQDLFPGIKDYKEGHTAVESVPEAEGKALPYLYIRVGPDQVSAALEKFKDVEFLAMTISKVTPAGLEALKGAGNLKWLNIYAPYEDHGRSPSTLETIGGLAGATSLELLNMEGHSKVTDISPLASLTNLKVLELGNCDTLADFSVISNLKNLHCLSLPPTTTNEQFAKVCEDHPNLKTFEVRYANKLTDIGPITKLTSLEQLSLYFSGPISDIKPVLELKKLRAYGHPRTAAPNDTLTEVCKGLPDLLTLGFTGSQVTNMSGVSNLKKLEVLHRGRVARRNKALTGFEGVTNLKTLRYIRLYGAKIADLSPISDHTNLVAIAMTGSAVTDLTALANLPNIEYLCFYSGYNLKNLNGIENMKKLVRMSLRGCKGLEDISALESTNLKYIYLQDCQKIQSFEPLTKIKSLVRVLGVVKKHMEVIQAANPNVRGRK